MAVAFAVALSLSVAYSAPAFATGTSYFVAKTGNDAWTGTNASFVSGSTGPFLTIQKCASVAIAGDTCNIETGTYRESVVPTNSGSAAAPIVYQPYSNQSVTIDGADEISATSWSVFSGSIYRTSITLPVASYSDTGFFANQLFVDGNPMTEARWPNNTGSLIAPTLATATGGTCGTTSTISATGLPSGLTGDQVWYVGAARWTSQVRPITSSAAGTASFSGAQDCSNIYPTSGVQFYVTGSLGLLDAANEWFYDGTNHYLYLWTPNGASPSTHTSVRVKERTNAFDLSGRSYVTIGGLSITDSTITDSSASSHNVIDGISAQYVTQYVTQPDSPAASGYGMYRTHFNDTGIVLNGGFDALRNSTIAFSAGNGVSLNGDNGTVLNNTIQNTDYAGDYNSPVEVNGSNEVVSYNTIANSGRDGIEVNLAPSDLNYNNISHYGNLTQDLAGIYSCCGQSGLGTNIDHNWIHDTDNNSLSAAVYIDNGNYDFNVHDNVTSNSGSRAPINFNGGINTSTNNTVNSAGPTWPTGSSTPLSSAPSATSISNVQTAAAGPISFDLSAVQGAYGYKVKYGTVSGSYTTTVDVGANTHPTLTGLPSGKYYFAADAYNGHGTSADSPEAIAIPSNFVQNGGFETGSNASWTWSSGSFSVPASNAHGGTYAVKATGASSGVGQIVYGLSPSTTYTATAWAKNDTAGETSKIGLKNYGGTEVDETIAGTTYTQASITFTTGSSSTSAELFIWKAAGTGSAYADDFTLALGGTPPNLVGNPGFETGSNSNWSWSSGSFSVPASNAHSGTYAAKATGASSGVGQIFNGLQPNTTYTATAWAKNDTAGETAAIGLKNFGGTDVSVTVAGTSYTQTTIVFTTGASNTTAEIYLWKAAGTGSAYADDFTVSLGVHQ